MLKIKILRGPASVVGQVFELKEGENTVGRADGCDIIINSPGISKKHARFSINGDSCAVTDLKSSNGTFVDGLKIQTQILRPGARIGFHDVIVELQVQSHLQPAQMPFAADNNAVQPWNSNAAVQQNPQFSPAAVSEPDKGFVQGYVEKVILPGVYSLATFYPMKNILAAFIFVFVFAVTILATIPMAQLTKEGVQKEGQRRAYMVAKQLASYAERTLSSSGGEAVIRTDFAEGEEGVTTAIIVSKEDGHIIAPITKANTYSNEEFVARARKKDETFIQQISDSILGVSIPIRTYNQEAANQTISAYAMILYKLDSIDLNASVALFARILIIAMLLGVIVYFLMYRLVIRPITEAKAQLDQALRGERESIATPYNFDVFSGLLEDVNSALARMGKTHDNQPQILDRTQEASNLVRIVNDPAFAVNGQHQFIQVNTAFEDLVGMRLLTLQGQNLTTLQDTALQQNLEDLCQRARAAAGTVISSQLDIAGLEYEIDVQASPESDGTVGYLFGTLKRRAP